MSYQPGELKRIFKDLPDQIKELIININSQETLLEIGRRHGLHIDQLGELVDEATLVLFGLTKSSDFLNHIKDRLRVDGGMAQKITTDINNEIFLPIRESLQKLAGQKETPAVTAPAPITPPPAAGQPATTPNIFEEKMGKM